MKELRTLLEAITKLTLYIELNYPELYRFLDENPLTLPAGPHPEISREELQEYLEGLHQMLKHHLETHEA